MGVLNLPNVNPHGYGVPQILSQWQAGQDRREGQKRYETELDFKKKQFGMAEKQFEQQTEMNKAEMENKQIMRIGSGLDNYNKRMDVAIKYFPKNKELAIPMIQDAVNIYNQISKSNIDASQITNEIEAKELRDKIADDGVTQLYKQAMSNPTPNNVSLFEVAKQKAYQGGISKGTYDGLKVEAKKEGSLTDVQKQAAMDKRAGYVPQTKKEAIELRKSGATQINLGEVADKIKTQEQAKDEAKWIGTSAREEAEKIAKNTIGDDWVDLTKDEKSAQTQTVLNRKLISIYGDKVKYGQDNGVLGWYLQDETGAMKLIKRWQ